MACCANRNKRSRTSDPHDGTMPALFRRPSARSRDPQAVIAMSPESTKLFFPPLPIFFTKERLFMNPDILIIQDQAGFHLLHGYLHLAMALNDSGKTAIDVPEFGTVLVARTPEVLVVETEGRHLQLLSH